MNNSIAISLENIRKSFGNTQAISDVSLDINEGELFGFIGPDGAGKTTLFRIIVTLLLQDSGRASVFGLDTGKDFKELRRMIGYMPGRFSLYQDLTVEENMQFWATVFGTTIQKNYHLVKDIYSHLEPFKNRKAGQLSGGMKQKLALSCALIHHPRLLMLDEPTTGVDAVSRKEFWEMLQRLKSHDITIVVSTPYMDEAELCERIAFIQQGKILSIESPSNLKNGFQGNLFEVKTPEIYHLKEKINAQFGEQAAWLFGQSIHVTTHPGGKTSPEALEAILKQSGAPYQLQAIEPGTEDCFIAKMTHHE